MKTLKTLKINFRNPKFKAFIYSLLCLLVIIVAVFLGIFYGMNKQESITTTNELTTPKIKPKENDPNLIKEKIKVIDENNKIDEVEVDVDKINKIGTKKIVIDEDGNKKTIDDEEKVKLINNINEKNDNNKNTNKLNPPINHTQDDEEIEKENDLIEKPNEEEVVVEKQKEELNNRPKEKTNNNSSTKIDEKQKEETDSDEKYIEDENGIKIKLQRFNIVDALNKNNELYELLNTSDLLNQPDIVVRVETEDPNVYKKNIIQLEFSEKEFVRKFEDIVKKTLKNFNEFKQYIDLFSYDIKYKFVNNRSILVIINWYYNNYSDNDRIRYYDELSIDYEG